MSTFSVVQDEQLCQYIRRARRKIVYIAPGVNKAVGQALAERLDELGTLSVTVIVDTDPEVCRLGYGDLEALQLLHKHASGQHFALRHQPGLRLGVLVADEAVLVYSPTPRLIEAGSTSPQKPNALVLDASAAAMIETAAGSDASQVLPSDAELGNTPITDDILAQVQTDLEKAPPQQFHLARQSQVVSSLISYVELEIKGVRLTQRRLKLPPSLLHADAGDTLLSQLTADIKPISADTAFEISLLLDSDGKALRDGNGRLVDPGPNGHKAEKYTPRRLAQEAKELRNRYLTVLPKYGTVIYNAQKADFEKEAEAYQDRLQAYLQKFAGLMKTQSGEQVSTITDLVMQRLGGKPPPGALPKEFPGGFDQGSIRSYVTSKVTEALADAHDLEGQVQWRYKAIAPESISRDSEFIKIIEYRFNEEDRKRLFRRFEAAEGKDLTNQEGQNI